MLSLAVAFSLSALACPASAPALEPTPSTTTDSAVVVVSAEQRAMCPGGSFHVMLRNRSDGKRDIKLCLMKDTGKWDCKETSDVAPNRTWTYWTCTTATDYWFTSREAGSKEPFAGPPTG